MATRTPSTTFGRWLDQQLKERGMSVRGLARAMTPENGQPKYERHQRIEQSRRLIHRTLVGSQPSPANRDRIADALGVSRDEMPDEDDEESEPMTLDAILQALVERRVSEELAKRDRASA